MASLTKKELKNLMDRAKLAFQLTMQMRQVLQRAYVLGAPDREGFNRGLVTGGGHANSWVGEAKQTRVFDSTYQDSIGQLSNDLVTGMFPPWAPWVELSPGPAVQGEDRKQLQRLLQEPQRIVQNALSSSNFDTTIQPVTTDLIFSTGITLVEPNRIEGVQTKDIPPWEMGVEQGPDGKISAVFRKYEVRVDKLEEAFPRGDFPDEMARNIREKHLTTIPVVAACHKYGDLYYQHVVWNDEHVLHEVGPFRKNPYACGRWSVLTGEVHGRGPALKMYPTAYTLNELMRLYLINTNFSVYGLYTVLNDGVINPSAFTPKPFGMLKVGSNQNDNPTLRPIPRDNQGWEMADRVIDRLTSMIKRGLYVDDLGDVEGPKMTATEVAERQAMIAKSKGAAYGRLTNEILIPVVERTVEVLQDQGALPRDFRVDGKVIQVRSISPLARAQQFDQVIQNQAYLESCARAAQLDPAAMALPNVVELLRDEAMHRGVDNTNLHTDQEIQQGLQQIGEAKTMAAMNNNPEMDPMSMQPQLKALPGGR